MSACPVRIILVEDSPSDAQLLQDTLQEASVSRFEFVLAERLDQTLARLQTESFDVVLLDLSLPDSRGSDTFLRVRAAAPRLPIVVLTGVEDELVGLDAVRHGVQDYLIKGQADGRQIARAIRYAIERQQVEEELRRARDELELRVQERTADLKQAVENLRTEIDVRKQTEVALTESEERYRRLFEFAPVGIALTDEGGHIYALNRTMCQMLDLPPEEAKAAQVTAFYADARERQNLMAVVSECGNLRDCETRLKRKDGSIFYAALHIDQVQLRNKRVLLKIVQDLTKRKQAEKHINGIRALLELFATVPSRPAYLDAVVKLLQDWCGCRCVGIRLLDDRDHLPYAAWVGFNRGFLKAESILSLGAEDCPCIRVMTGKPRPQDGVHMDPKGSFFCNQSSRSESLLAAGPRAGEQVPCLKYGFESVAHAPIRYCGQIVGTIHLTDRKEGKFPPETLEFIESVAPLLGEALHRFKVEESLHESESRFRSMFESSHAIMLLVEPKSGALVDANPAATAFYGHSRERLRTLYLRDLGMCLPGATAAARRCGAKAPQDYCETSTRLSSGALRAVEVHASSITVQEQPLVFAIVHDVTERKFLEKQVIEISERERQRLGQDLHDSLGGKLAGAALMSKALSQTLAARSLSEVPLAEEIVQCINESIAQARSIARGLCPVELSGSGLVSGLRELASEIERRFGVSCRVHAGQGVRIDDVFVASHLFRIVQEAVTNAVRHGQAQNVAIRLTRTADEVSLEVRDNGTGLPPNLNETQGMGLRTMKHRAGSIGAQLAVRPGEGGGTVVACSLPLRQVPAKKKA
jgi:PAS domain S-box-containing protein